jgi:hypothetical protein
MQIVPILYRKNVFEAFGDFNDFAESVSYGTSKTCQDRGSTPGLADRGVTAAPASADFADGD